MDYKEFYNKVGAEMGWDFSKLKTTTEGEEWELYEEVQKISKPDDIILDIGTGGGEKVLSIADYARLVIGIDMAEGMIHTAHNNQKESGKNNVRFFVMDANQLQFPSEFFNIISNRHSAFSSSEVFRSIVNGGIFITQQVGDIDKLNIKQSFGRGQNFGVEEGTAMRKYVEELKSAGFSEVEFKEYNADEYYETAEDLIFLLKHTPIVPNFGQEEGDFEKLEQFIKDNTTKKGIQTNSKRYMIIANKS